MAYGLKYTITFKDINNIERRIDISYDNYLGVATDISEQAYSSPIVINIPDVDQMDTVMATGATLKFYKNGVDFFDLFTTNPFGIRVELFKGTILDWSGYVSVESYFENISDNDPLIEITCNDGLAGLERTPYYNNVGIPLLKGLTQVKTCLSNIFAQLNHTNIYFVNNIIESNITNAYDIFNMYVDGANYINEDADSMTMREVLESILDTYRLRLIILGKSIWLVNINSLYNSPGNQVVYKLSRAFSLVTTKTFNNIINKQLADYEYIGASQTITLLPGINKQILKYQPYPSPLWFWKNFNDIPKWEIIDFIRPASNIYISRPTSLPDLSNYGISFTQRESPAGGWPFLIANAPEATTGDFVIGVEHVIRTGTTASVTIDAGYIRAVGESVGIGLKVMFADGQYCEPPDFVIQQQLVKIVFKISVKVGTKYGFVLGSPHEISVNGDAETLIDIVVDLHNEQILNRWNDVFINLKHIGVTGPLQIKIYDYLNIYSEDGAGYAPTSSSFLLFKDFEAMPGGAAIDDSCVEFIGQTDVNFIKSQTKTIIHGDRRNGCLLDRGMLFGNVTTPAENWKLIGDADYVGHARILLRHFLSQLKTPTRKLTATISGLDILSNADGAYFLRGKLTPVTLLQDSNLPGLYVMSGGDYDVQEQEFDGQFIEIKEISEL